MENHALPHLSRWGTLLAVAGSYAAVLLAWTWPLGARLASAFPAVAGHDGYMQIWSVWHFRERLLAGHNPFYSDWLLYPEGASLLMTTYTPIIGMLNVLVNNEMLALNLMLLAQYTLSGVGAWLLVRRWVHQPLLQWLAGFVFAFSPYKMLRLPEHYNLVLTATVPFFVLAFLRAFEFRAGWQWPLVRSWRAVAACLVIGLLTLVSDYYITFALLYFALGYALWFWLRLGEINWWRRRSWLMLAGILLVSHIALRLLRLAGVPDNGGFWWGGDVLGYFLPPPNSYWLDAAWTQRLFTNARVFNMPGSIENIMFLGFALPLLGLAVSCWPGKQLSARHQDPQARPLAWLLLFSVLLTLPALRIFGKSLLNLPTGFLHLVPFFNNIRCPTRWVLLVSLLLPLVVFAALEARWKHWPRRWQWLLSAGLVVAVGGEYWPVAPPLASSSALPPAFRAVAALPGEVLLTVPVGLVDGRKQVGEVELVNFLYQPHHRKKLLSAYLSRIPDARFEAFERGDSVLQTLLRLQQAPADTAVHSPSAAAAGAFRQRYQPAAMLISPEWRGGAAHRYIKAAVPDFREEYFADGYVLLRPNGPPTSAP